MCNGASTWSFKHSENQNEDVYYIGKIGELCYHDLLKKCIDKYGINILHVPFRDNYSNFDWDDDFIIATKNNRRLQLEIRTKARNVDLEDDFECCSDSIKPHLTYVFFSFNRKNNLCSVAGWANWDIWKKYGYPVLKGTSNNNFVHKVNEFNVPVKNLNHIKKMFE